MKHRMHGLPQPDTRPLGPVRWLAVLLGALLIASLPRPAAAQVSSTLVRASAVVDSAPLIAGTTAQLAVTINTDPGYHIQSARPHDAYLIPTRVQIAPVDGLTFSAPRYPQHIDIASNGLSTEAKLAVYENTVYVLVPLQIAKDAAPGPRTIHLTLRTQACNDVSCFPPQTAQLAVPVTIAAAGSAATPLETALFEKAEAQKFLPPEPAPAAPATSALPPAVSGLSASENPSAAGEVAAINSRDYRPANIGGANPSLWLLALLALAGGCILNVMPCVLPVIPLKVLTLVQQSHGDRRKAILHAVAFAAGIIALFIVLAVVLGSYRYFGGENLYGKQFQSPIFLIAMAMLVLALALSMLGVWTINPPRALYMAEAARARGEPSRGSTAAAQAGVSGYLNAFSMGVLATLLATPCSAPLLGPVLAWALVQPLTATILAFAMVGVGMALPYVILAAFPGWLSRLPRAGRWSELLKQGLGLVMVGVTVYLITLLDPSYWPWVMVGGVILAGVCWGWGQIPVATMSLRKIWSIRAAVVAAGVVLTIGLIRWATPTPGVLEWQPFSISALDAGLASGKPVVVDWTATWCINCRAVEAGVLNSTSVQQAFRQRGAVLLRADITNHNPPAETLLAKLDGRAIPFLAIFSPGAPLQPTVLRDLYTRDRVITELRNASTLSRPPLARR